jgi:hypothetical protein
MVVVAKGMEITEMAEKEEAGGGGSRDEQAIFTSGRNCLIGYKQLTITG